MEYREAGFDDRAAILKGVYKTGGIITAAGTIMAIAFAGLLLSSLKVFLVAGGIALCCSGSCDWWNFPNRFVRQPLLPNTTTSQSLNELGFVLCVAVLIDTFIVRTLSTLPGAVWVCVEFF